MRKNALLNSTAEQLGAHQDRSAPLKPAAQSVPAALAYSGLSRSGLYRAAARGEIEFRKVGRSTLVLTDSLDRFLASLPAPVLRAPPPASKR